MFDSRKVVPVLAITLGVVFLAPSADAQTALDRRFTVSLNGGVQTPSSSRTDVTTFDLNREAGTLRGTQSLGPYGVLDGEVAVRLWKQVGLGVSVARAQGTSSASVEADVPHPFFFEFDRLATTAVDGLEHREVDYHLSARLRVPLGASTLVVVSGGPTYFDASQQFVTGIETAERGDPFNEVDVLSTTVEEVAVSAWGYHVGVDVAYFGLRDLGFLGQWSLLDHLGVGLKVRYSRGKPDIDLRGVRQERALQVGLAHIVGGLRIVF